MCACVSLFDSVCLRSERHYLQQQDLQPVGPSYNKEILQFQDSKIYSELTKHMLKVFHHVYNLISDKSEYLYTAHLSTHLKSIVNV